MILCSIIPVARSGANWRRARFAAQFVRCIMGAPQVSALSMHADSEEVSRRCSDFLQICRQHGGEGTVDLTISNTVAEVKLNNWDRRNALSGKMMLELEKVVSDLEQWPEGKAVIVYGEQDAFCSGGDLDFVRRIATPELGVQMSFFMQHTLDRLANLPQLVVAMVRGVAHGGGAELTTASDFRIHTRNTDVRFVQAKLGITTGWGGASRLARLIGHNNALYYLISGETITAGHARSMGLCNLVCSHNSEGLDMTRLWLADNFLSKSVQVIRAYKQAIRQMHGSTLAESYRYEMEAFRNTWGSAAHLDALGMASGISAVELKSA